MPRKSIRLKFVYSQSALLCHALRNLRKADPATKETQSKCLPKKRYSFPHQWPLARSPYLYSRQLETRWTVTVIFALARFVILLVKFTAQGDDTEAKRQTKRQAKRQAKRQRIQQKFCEEREKYCKAFVSNLFAAIASNMRQMVLNVFGLTQMPLNICNLLRLPHG